MPPLAAVTLKRGWFALADGEDIADAAQRMIHTIRQRLAVSRTPSAGSVRPRDELEFV